MNRKEIYAIVVVLVAAIVLHAYISSVRDTSKADQVKSDVQQQIADLRNDLKNSLAEIAKDKQTVKTPEQVVQKIPQYIELPKPIYIQPPTPVTASSPNSLPDAPSTIKASTGDLVIPKESASAFFQFTASCKEDSLKLQECSKELPLMEQRAKAAETAMKGGSFFTRVKRNAKWLGIGIGIGAAAGYAATH